MASESETTGVLEGLRAERQQVSCDTWHHEPELMALLEQAHSLYWECFSLLEGHHMKDDVERALIYVGASAFHSLQTAFVLIESGYYRQAAVAIRLLMNEYLVCNLARQDREFAATFLSGSDWSTVRQLAADFLRGPNGADVCPDYLVSLLSTAVEQRLSFQAYIAVEELQRCKQVPKKLKRKLTPLREELSKDRMPGMTPLLRALDSIGLSRESISQYRSDLELLHRHAHSAGVAIKAEVVATDEQGGQWLVPRYERGRCRYCGYRTGLWSAAVLNVLRREFERLSTDKGWTRKLERFDEALLTWGEKAHVELEASRD